PSVIVVIDQTYARAIRVNDQPLVCRAHRMFPARQPGRFGHILKNDRTRIDEPARRTGRFCAFLPSPDWEVGGTCPNEATVEIIAAAATALSERAPMRQLNSKDRPPPL